jgi:isocitrate lyase
LYSEELPVFISKIKLQAQRSADTWLEKSSCQSQSTLTVSVSYPYIVAVRLQFDIMGVENIIVARTDAEAATLITSTIDTRDHPFVLGSTNASLKPLGVIMAEAQSKGLTGPALQSTEDKWIADAGIKLYSEAVADALKASGKSAHIASFLSKTASVSNAEARALAKSLGVDPFWCWDSPRTREGFYRYQGGTQL